MKIIETRSWEIGFVLWGHCQNLLDDPRMCMRPDWSVMLVSAVTFLGSASCITAWSSGPGSSGCLTFQMIKKNSQFTRKQSQEPILSMQSVKRACPEACIVCTTIYFQMLWRPLKALWRLVWTSRGHLCANHSDTMPRSKWCKLIMVYSKRWTGI